MNRAFSLVARAATDRRAVEFWPYVVAVVSTILATLVRMLLDPLLGEKFPYITYMFAFVFVAWYGGLWPSFLSLVLGFLSAFYFFCYPRGSVEVYGLESQVGALLYVAVGMASVLFSESMHASRRRADAIALELLDKKNLLEREVEEKRAAQDGYVKLLRRLVTAQEEERRRIAQELHDQCGQDLTALDLGLKFLESGAGSDSAVQNQIRGLHAVVGRVAEEVHHLTLKLRPTALDELGLCAALSHYLETWSAMAQIPVDFEPTGWADDSRVLEEVETAVYRTVQEAMNNVAKHAEATSVSVILERTPSSVVAIVEDQGKGFLMEEAGFPTGIINHLGLLGMRERIEAVGGKFEIESAIGQGTTVYVRVPVAVAVSQEACHP